jgi:hypothetical protein
MLSLALAACGGEEATSTPTQTSATNTPAATTPPGTTPTATTQQPTPTTDPGFDAEAYFKGKTITMMVGFAPGGGTDAQGRYFAANWPDYIPGKPKMIVRNLTPVLTERNFTWNAKPDGFTLATEATPGVNDQLDPAAQFDMREVTAIGATSGGDSFWAIWNSLNYGCADTAIGGAQTITLADKVPSPEAMESTAFNAGLASLALGGENMPLRLIHVAGDTGSNAQRLMLERGDVNSWSSATVWSQLPRTNPGWVADEVIKPFLDMSFSGVVQPGNTEQPSGEFGCGKVEDYVAGGLEDPKVQRYYKFADVRTSFSKNIIGPPGMDPNVVAALRKALDDAMNDPSFVEGMERASGIPTRYTAGAQFDEDIDRITNGFLDSQTEYRDVAQEIFDTYVQ